MKRCVEGMECKKYCQVVSQRVVRWFEHVEKIDEQRMAKVVTRSRVSGE